MEFKINEKFINESLPISKMYKSLNGKTILFGISPIAPIHLGYDLFIYEIKEAVGLGVSKVNFILADLHSVMTHDISYENIRERINYYEYYFKTVCDIKNVDFKIGSDFQKNNNYTELLYSMLRVVPMSKVKSTLPTQKKNEPLYSYNVLYSIMQCIDILYHNADIVISGVDQKKIYSLAHYFNRALFPERNSFTKNIDFLYFKLIQDIKGNSLNNSTSKTRINIHETPDSLKKKIDKMYAPPLSELNNKDEITPPLEMFKYSVFPWFKNVEINSKIYCNYNECLQDWESGKLHPKKLKDALFEYLSIRLDDIQTKFKSGLTNWIDFEKL